VRSQVRVAIPRLGSQSADEPCPRRVRPGSPQRGAEHCSGEPSDTSSQPAFTIYANCRAWWKKKLLKHFLPIGVRPHQSLSLRRAHLCGPVLTMPEAPPALPSCMFIPITPGQLLSSLYHMAFVGRALRQRTATLHGTTGCLNASVFHSCSCLGQVDHDGGYKPKMTLYGVQVSQWQ
jgi:hypothetical protein